MRRILPVLFVVLLVAGCIPSLEDTETMIKEGYIKLKAELQKDLGVDEYNMRIGDYVTVDNKMVRLESYNPDYITVFDVDGDKREMGETQDPQIINGLELTILKFQYDTSDMENNYVKVKIVKYVPKEDEYLFSLNEEKEILGHTIKLNKLDKDGTITISVDVINELRIMEDITEGIADILVSNVRPNYRAISYERYVIVKIVEKP